MLSPSEVATELMSLPRRTAFVRSGEDVGAIHTHDTLEPVSWEEFLDRLGRIRWQTIEKYCKPKAEVEGAPDQNTNNNPPDDNQEPPLSRWEEV